MLGSDSTGMRCAVCSALARIAKVTALPLPSGADADRPDSVSKLSLVRKLVSMIKTSKEDSKVGLCYCVLSSVCINCSHIASVLSYWCV